MNQKGPILDSLLRLERWVEDAQWKAYDTFDGLSSPYATFFTLDKPLLKQVWQQGVRRFPLNLRPLLGIKPEMSTKAMGFFALGYLKLYQAFGRESCAQKARFCLDWLIENRAAGFKGYCWGNHFDYQSRGGNIAKGTPTIVWTGLIGHAFLEGYEVLGEERYLGIASSACDFIVNELGWMDFPEGICLQYYPKANIVVHNSSMLGASLLARVNAMLGRPRFLEVAEKAIRFTLHHQTSEGAWYYGVGKKWNWIDSFHTAYVLEALDTFCQTSGRSGYLPALEKGYRYFVETFFGEDGTPRYYADKTLPLDIQCASQAIQTLVNLRRLHPGSIELARKVASWTIANMQDASGYFYYRKYPLLTNKTPTLHWGQATMFAALACLEKHLATESNGRTNPGGRSGEKVAVLA